MPSRFSSIVGVTRPASQSALEVAPHDGRYASQQPLSRGYALFHPVCPTLPSNGACRRPRLTVLVHNDRSRARANEAPFQDLQFRSAGVVQASPLQVPAAKRGESTLAYHLKAPVPQDRPCYDRLHRRRLCDAHLESSLVRLPRLFVRRWSTLSLFSDYLGCVLLSFLHCLPCCDYQVVLRIYFEPDSADPDRRQ